MRSAGLRFTLVICCVCTLGTFGAPPGAAAHGKRIRVIVDPRVELMSIVFRLAGNPEYNGAKVASYSADVDAYFAAFKAHPAVEMARNLRATAGIGYDAPMDLAVYVRDPQNLAERVPLDPRPEEMDPRWRSEDLRAFIAKLRDFVRDTKFETFIESHETFYGVAAGRLDSVIARQDVAGWFDGFFGASGSEDFTIALGLLNGGNCYGASVRLADGSKEIYSILGVWSTDSKGVPTFDFMVVPTVVHEFCHCYMNQLVDRHEAELRAAGEKIFSLVENDMRSQAYTDWKIMMYESLVRAASVCYTFSHFGPEGAEREIAYDKSVKFIWTDELAKLLHEYESNRANYPTLDAFFPRITAFFNDYSARVGNEIARIREQQSQRMQEIVLKGPRIVSAVPPNGAEGVSPELSMIKITFDRHMMLGNMGLWTVSEGEFPATTGKPDYDSTCTVLMIPVKLKPDTKYAFSLNVERQLNMQDEHGNPLVPTLYTFRTRKQ